MKLLTWNDIENISDSEISYLLYLEGKDIRCIALIRGMDKSKIENDIIHCKIKYRAYEGTNKIEDVIEKLKNYAREERKNFIKTITDEEKIKIEKYCSDKLFDSNKDDCIFYIWLLGEIKSANSVPQIVTFLKCTDGNIKRMCCSALSKIGDGSCENALLAVTYDKRPQVRQYAVKALGNLKSKKSIDRLEEIFNLNEEKDYVKRAAELSIDLIQNEG